VKEAGDYRRTLFVVRYVLPSALCVAGLVLLAIGPGGTALEGGLGLIGAGLAAFLFAFLAKVSMSGDTFRDREEEARRFFDEHGYWPDEDPSRRRR
jgi:threonine dehydrogenase-like Zn-dependent dehydrogenase